MLVKEMLLIHIQDLSKPLRTHVAVSSMQVFILYPQTFRLVHKQVQHPTEDLLTHLWLTVFHLRQVEI